MLTGGRGCAVLPGAACCSGLPCARPAPSTGSISSPSPRSHVPPQCAEVCAHTHVYTCT